MECCDEIGDALKSPIDRGKTDIGHLIFLTQVFQHQLANRLATDFSLGLLLNLGLDIFDKGFYAL